MADDKSKRFNLHFDIGTIMLVLLIVAFWGEPDLVDVYVERLQLENQQLKSVLCYHISEGTLYAVWVNPEPHLICESYGLLSELKVSTWSKLEKKDE